MIDKKFFQQTKLFGELKFFEWEEIAKIAEEKEYKAGDTVFRQGETSTDLYVVVRGEIEIHIAVAPQLAAMTVYIVKSKDVFGEFAFIDPEPRSASAGCRTDVTLAVIKKHDFEELIKKFPNIGINFYQSLARILSIRLRKTNKYMRDMFLRSLGLEV